MNGLVNRLRQTSQSAVVRAVATLMGGNAVAMLVPILAAPILGRLYTPADYGALAQYMAAAAVLAVLASLQLQHAIIAERTDRGAARVAWVVLIAGLIGATFTAIAVSILWRPLLAETGAGSWFLLLPLTVIGAGVLAAGSFLANRHRAYGWIARIQICHVLATVAVSIALGFWGWGADGLLAAYFLGQLIQLFAYLWLMFSLRETVWPPPGRGRMWVAMRRHWKFPAFTLPSGFASQVNLQAPVFALSALGAEASLGAFSRARQLASMPATLVGQSVAQVFRREASEVYQRTGNCRPLIVRTAARLLAMGIVPCALFIVFAPWLFTFYLGPAWDEAGRIAQILAPMLLIRVVVAPISTVLFFTDHQLLDLSLAILSAALIALSIGLGWMAGGSASTIIAGFAIGYGIVYLLYGAASWKVALRTNGNAV